jgi:hypothetical protein
VELTRTLRQKQEWLQSRGSSSQSTELITSIENLKEEISTSEKLIKSTRKDYVVAYADAVSMQKLIDFYSQQKKEFEDSIAEEEEDQEEAKLIIKEQEEKDKQQKIIQRVIQAQKDSFEAHQKKVVIEEKIQEYTLLIDQQTKPLNATVAEQKSLLAEEEHMLKIFKEEVETLTKQLKDASGKAEVQAEIQKHLT